MPLKILYFAALRERMGRAEEDIATPPGAPTVAGLVAFLKDRDDRGTLAFARPELVRAAVNQEFASLDAAIHEGDEIAFFPPVTGG